MVSFKSANVPLAITGLIGVSAVLMDFLGQSIRNRLNKRQRRAWLTANQYHLTHTIALATVACMMPLAQESPEAASRLQKGFYLVMAGALGFGGSIYSLSVGMAPKFMGPMTPTSGLILVLGWLNVGLAGLYW